MICFISYEGYPESFMVLNGYLVSLLGVKRLIQGLTLLFQLFPLKMLMKFWM